MKNEVKYTMHARYRRVYPVVFAPKYHRKVINNKIRRDIGKIIEADACVDHIHIRVSIPPYTSVSLVYSRANVH